MASSIALLVLCCCSPAGVGAVTINSYDQGQEFTKCVTITDFQTKTLADDITLVDRNSGGCCPTGSTPGAKFFNSYQSAQIACGFQSDGTVGWSTSTSGGNTTCTYNKCYVMKQNLPCADGSKQLLNGCCAATDANNKGFQDLCKNYWKSFTTVNSETVNFCTTYHKNYGSKGYGGTQGKTDDQAGGKLVPDKIYTYAKCEGGSVTDTNSNTQVDGAARVVLSFAALGAIATLALS